MDYYDPYETRSHGQFPELMPMTAMVDYLIPGVTIQGSLGQFATQIGLTATNEATPEVEKISSGQDESDKILADDSSFEDMMASRVSLFRSIQEEAGPGVDRTIRPIYDLENSGYDEAQAVADEQEIADASRYADDLGLETGIRQATGTGAGLGPASEEEERGGLGLEQPGVMKPGGGIVREQEIPWTLIGLGLAAFILLAK